MFCIFHLYKYLIITKQIYIIFLCIKHFII